MFATIPNNVSLTCDVCSAPNGLPQSYICITAHWVDPQSWQLCKLVITFEVFGAPHSGDRQFSIIKKNLQWYNLYAKIINISFDNASNNTRCKRVLNNGQLFHTRCCAHIINLVVQDGLETCKRVLNKFRVMIRRIYNKGKSMQQA